jgi:hypothetical protein
MGPGEPVVTSVDVPLKANAKVFLGGMVALDSSGYGVAPSAALGLRVCGRFAPEHAATVSLDNTGGANGALVARVEQGVFRYGNSSSGDAIAQANLPCVVYAVDDQTVALTDGGGTRSPAGIAVAVDSIGVYVSMSLQMALFVERLGGASFGAAPDEQISASGALSVTKRTSILSVSGTKAYTLADGTYVGQRKTIFCRSAASTPNGVVTPAHPNNFLTITFASANAFVDLEWNGTAWDIVGVGGTVTIA